MSLPVHFFTLALDAEPYIRWHIAQFEKLPFRWHWHIIEGCASPVRDTSWCAKNGGRIPARNLARDYHSSDDTLGYARLLSKLSPRNVTLYEKRGPWHGKLEMVEAPLLRIDEPCLLMEIDADELWTTEQIRAIHGTFSDNPGNTAAIFRCHYFVGPDLVITSLETYGNHDGEWRRAWRYQPGDRWERHEPPVLTRNGRDLATIAPLGYGVTVPAGLTFQHFAYATEKQLSFKRDYYGYKNAVEGWKRLQDNNTFPCKLRDYFDWVKDEAVVDRAENVGIVPLIKC